MTDSTSQPTADYFANMRIFADPAMRSDWRTIVRQIEALIPIAERFGATHLVTAEPCSYRFTDHGLRHLGESLRQGCVSHLFISAGDNYAVPRGSISIELFLGGSDTVGWATMYRVSSFLFDERPFRDMVTDLRSLVEEWFVPMHGVSAFVDALHERDLVARETKSRLGRRSPSEPSALREWDDVTRFVDSARWGMALAPQLYRVLGTREQVLKTAPVAIARPLGDAVWLQVSDEPPADEQALTALSGYIRPLLAWTDADINRNTKRVLSQYERGGRVDTEGLTRLVDAPTGEEAAQRQEFPLIFLEHEYETVMNIHCAESLAEEAREGIAGLVLKWWRLSFTGIYSTPNPIDKGIEYLGGPHTCDSVMRWAIKWGEIDSVAALTDLHRALQTMDDPKIERMVIGLETVG